MSRVLSHILRIARGLDGITLTGGEPFEQSDTLAQLLERLAQARPGWDTLVYSGYSLPQLERRGPAVQRLLAYNDILVAGPNMSSRPPTHPLTGSGNQDVHFMTRRGEGLRDRCDRLPVNQANLGTGPDGRDLLIGILSPTARAQLHRSLGLRHEGIGHG